MFDAATFVRKYPHEQEKEAHMRWEYMSYEHPLPGPGASGEDLESAQSMLAGRMTGSGNGRWELVAVIPMGAVPGTHEVIVRLFFKRQAVE